VYIVPMYHPAMALYSPKSRDLLKMDFAKLKHFI
jgi:uracil-DNA glycosylase